MKIAIASTTKNLDGKTDERGGRAPYYLIINEQGELIDSIKNPFAIGGGGAGIGAAKMLADKGIKKVVAENIGDKMQNALAGRNLDYEHFSGPISDYVRKLK